ncbi:hypothetical protein [Magnetospirillum sp. 15-1]|uniref:hypothetical protein n=1 Tax=Magnetospirillum sp. 15-1 TaxID=1979370 RepID=UPI001142931B|nr:hypothetical protein [Magnetospirillum sp. 15-1]
MTSPSDSGRFLFGPVIRIDHFKPAGLFLVKIIIHRRSGLSRDSFGDNVIFNSSKSNALPSYRYLLIIYPFLYLAISRPSQIGLGWHAPCY